MIIKDNSSNNGGRSCSNKIAILKMVMVLVEVMLAVTLVVTGADIMVALLVLAAEKEEMSFFGFFFFTGNNLKVPETKTTSRAITCDRRKPVHKYNCCENYAGTSSVKPAEQNGKNRTINILNSSVRDRKTATSKTKTRQKRRDDYSEINPKDRSSMLEGERETLWSIRQLEQIERAHCSGHFRSRKQPMAVSSVRCP
ncbi:hypothetical protein RRG08_038706 [Elysia crispata]|uniref:Uncharacterized protein n=1 Tax=Elysia crispata TaxID=231223 RepID=A0AAE0ZJ08_9GAST|nr:hypothetical protein RRG08_038706 [Elysia crispata]